MSKYKHNKKQRAKNIQQLYLNKFGGDKIAAARDFAIALMKDDPREKKKGLSMRQAQLNAFNLFRLSDDEIKQVEETF